MSSEQQQAISDVIIAYATAIDTRDWVKFKQCFTDDVSADYGDFGRWASLDSFTQFMIDVHVNVGATLHRISNIVISVEGSTANAKTYVDALLMPLDVGGEPQRGIGYYQDELVSTNKGWKISQRIFTLVHTA